MKNDLETLRYPIGRFKLPNSVSTDDLSDWIEIIDAFPSRIKQLVSDLTEDQINTRYREGGWTVRQVVHHCYDSHHNSYNRFKWTLTEELPEIKAYDEARWCALEDSMAGPIDLSLKALDSLHNKWVYLLKGLSEDQWRRRFIHPDHDHRFDLRELLALYAWHCDHHYAHIKQLLIRKGWIG